MSDDLVAQLRERTEGAFTDEDGFHTGPDALCIKAADAIERMRTALTIAASAFREYERLHLAKGTDEGRHKAQANANIAKTCEAALSPAST